MFRHWKKNRHGHPRTEAGAAEGLNGLMVPYHQAFEFRPLPGAGAGQWAWETLLLPLYTPIGAGTQNLRQFKAVASNPVYVAYQGITLADITGGPVGGQLTGQFATGSLVDISGAEDSGLMNPAYGTTSSGAGGYTVPSPRGSYQMPLGVMGTGAPGPMGHV